MSTFNERLLQKGIRPSVQRLMIYEYLYKNHNHPSVDDIYKALSVRIPSLSRTTVYNTLKRFVENGLAVVVNVDEHEARYDADTSNHAHFKCTACGNFFDMHMPLPPLHIPAGFEYENYQIHIKGRCNKCNA